METPLGNTDHGDNSGRICRDGAGMPASHAAKVAGLKEVDPNIDAGRETPRTCWEIVIPSKTNCLPTRRSRHCAAVVVPGVVDLIGLEHSFLLLGGYCQPWHRAKELTPLAFDASKTPGALLGTSINSHEDGCFGWRVPRWHLPCPLLSCSAVVVDGFLVVFGGLRADSDQVTGDQSFIGEGRFHTHQVTGDLCILDVSRGKWLQVRNEVAKGRDVNSGTNPSVSHGTSTLRGAADEQFFQEGEAPVPCFEHAAAVVQFRGRRMLVHGGRTARHPAPLDSVCCLEITSRALRWSRLHPARVHTVQGERVHDHGQVLQAQARKRQFSRRAHTLCAVPGTPSRMILFGGRMESGEDGRICSELMVLEVSAEEAWYRISPQQAMGTAPSARAYHSAVVVGQFMVVFGGLNRQGAPLCDVHLLQLGPLVWSSIPCPPSERASIHWPSARWAHAAAALEPAGCRSSVAMLVFGGIRADGALLDDVHCLSLEAVLSLTGASTERAVEALNAYSENIVLSLCDRLFANLGTLQNGHMRALSRVTEDTEDIFRELCEMEQRFAEEEGNATAAQRNVNMAEQRLESACEQLKQLQLQQMATIADTQRQIYAGEARVKALRHRLDRLQLTQDILELECIFPARDVNVCLDDTGAVVNFGKPCGSPEPMVAIEGVRRRVGAWCGTAVTVEEIALPPCQQTDIDDDSTSNMELTVKLSRHRPAWETAARRELQLVGKLRHPNLLECYGAAFVGDSLLLVSEPPLIPVVLALETFEGQRIKAACNRLRIVLHVALALEYLHARGVVHRYIALHHVFLKYSPSLVVKLGGLVPGRVITHARCLSRAQTKTEDMHLRMAACAIMECFGQVPEGCPDARSADIFALGVLAVHLLTTDQDGLASTRDGEPMRHSVAISRIPDKALRLVVMRCTETLPHHRMSASMVVRALRTVGLGGTVVGMDVIPNDTSRSCPLVDRELDGLFDLDRQRHI